MNLGKDSGFVLLLPLLSQEGVESREEANRLNYPPSTSCEGSLGNPQTFAQSGAAEELRD